jgi:OOP family OmpA-OmpF porin
MNFSKLAKTFGFSLLLCVACSYQSFSQGAMAMTTDTTVVDDNNTMVVDTVLDSNNGDPIQVEPATQDGAIMSTDTTSAAPVLTETAPAVVPASEAKKIDDGSSASSRQKTLKGGRFYNRFSIGLNGGVARMGNFLSQDEFKNNEYKAAGGITVTGYLGHAFALQLAFNVQNDLQGDSVRYTPAGQAKIAQYNTKNGDLTMNLVYNFGNISFMKRQPRLGMYAHIGIGVTHYKATIYTYNKPKYETNYLNDIMMPVGAGIKYMLTKQLTASTGYMIKFVGSDKFDNTFINFNNDKYSYGYVGLAYTLGNKAKPSMEWNNPVAVLYDDASNNDRINKLSKKINALQEQLDSVDMNVTNRLDSMRMDADGDGVADYFDKQPNTPEGAIIDGSGRALDSDGDGVFDAYDKCPFEKGLPEFNGCKSASGSNVKLGSEEETIVNEVNSKLLFTKGSANLDRSTHKPLNKLVKLMKKNPNLYFALLGYTDSDGGEMMNNKLSQDRADAVKEYLVKKDIAPSRLTAVGKGIKKPFDPNASEIEKQKNRTVILAATAK